MFEARHSVVVLPFTRPPRQEPLRGLLRILRVRLVVVLALIAGLKPAVGCSDLASSDVTVRGGWECGWARWARNRRRGGGDR